MKMTVLLMAVGLLGARPSPAADWPSLKSYTGEHLRRIKLPLGGIGTGTVSLSGRGALVDWELRGKPAKGLTPTVIMARHVLRNALIPIVTYVSLSIPYLFTGSLLLESFFGIPGLGSVSINAIHSADMAVVRAVVVLGSLLYQFVNLLTDVLYAFLDPRIRFLR